MIKLTEQDIKWYNEGQNKFSINEAGNLKPTYDHWSSDEFNVFDKPYKFIIEYLANLFLKPDSPWLEGFWEWMKEKKYARYNDDFECYLVKVKVPMYDSLFVFPKSKMLTGYIIKYMER